MRIPSPSGEVVARTWKEPLAKTLAGWLRFRRNEAALPAVWGLRGKSFFVVILNPPGRMKDLRFLVSALSVTGKRQQTNRAAIVCYDGPSRTSGAQ